MKIPALTVLALAAAFSSSSFAGEAPSSKEPVMAPPPPVSDAGFFVGTDVGDFWMKNLSAGNSLKVDVKFRDGGRSVNVPFGYDFGNGLSIFASAGYERANLQQLTGELGGFRQTASTQGRMSFIPLLGNASYSFKIFHKLSWYIGGGIGAVHETASFRTYDSHTNRSITFGQLGHATAVFDGLTDSSWQFGYNAFTGLSYEICRNVSVDVGYRFIGVDSHVSVNGDNSSKLRGQVAEAGVRIKF